MPACVFPPVPAADALIRRQKYPIACRVAQRAAVSSKSAEEKAKLEKMSVGLKAAKCGTTLSGRSRDGIRLELSYALKFSTDAVSLPWGWRSFFRTGRTALIFGLILQKPLLIKIFCDIIGK